MTKKNFFFIFFLEGENEGYLVENLGMLGTQVTQQPSSVSGCFPKFALFIFVS